MLKIATAAVGLIALPTIAAAQSKAELMVGWLDYSAGTITQDLGVRNNGRLPIKAVKIGCRFFRDADQLHQLGTGSAEIENIVPDSAGYKTLRLESKTPAQNASCHVISVKH